MELNNIFNGLTMVQTGITILKAFMIFISLIYFIYAITFSRRVKIMNQNLKTGYEKGFTGMSKLHVLLSFISIIFFLLSAIY